ncbi:hypothetical protein [Micromonospora sp. CB01531]|uniref:hypothetical protein n=1 Tax=Micromonospora sp. CB01531 TaxID=1718947 RepID=UPI00093CFB08|nr:hypothetical protein [Micromonospora sp. CB01531]OKI44018.1 hypothetical protein A6A27_38670 [Micromonospora sp. CB01531]
MSKLALPAVLAAALPAALSWLPAEAAAATTAKPAIVVTYDTWEDDPRVPSWRKLSSSTVVSRDDHATALQAQRSMAPRAESRIDISGSHTTLIFRPGAIT